MRTEAEFDAAEKETARLRTLLSAHGIHQCEEGVTEECTVCDSIIWKWSQQLNGLPADKGVQPQPAPVRTEKSQAVLPVALNAVHLPNGVAELVVAALGGCLDMPPDEIQKALIARAEDGVKKYGTPLMSFNGRDAREDLRQELLDALMYAAQCQMEGK